MSNHELAEKITDMLFTTKGRTPVEGRNLRLYTDTISNNGVYIAGLSKEATNLYIKQVIDEHFSVGEEETCQVSA